MKRTTTPALLGLACLLAIPSITQARYRDGMNLYQYVRSTPTKFVDPQGSVPVIPGPNGAPVRLPYPTPRDEPAQPATKPATQGHANPKRAKDPKCEWCGPEVAGWLVGQMNKNRNHWVIKNSREIQWPNYIPFFNLGWNAGFLNDFRNLVKAGGPWDFKVTEPFTRGKCPTDKCKGTVTICGICFYKDVPGNIHYGYVGRVAGLREWVIYSGGHGAAPGFSDGPDDRVAISIGIEIANKGTALCTLIGAKQAQLSKLKTKGCTPCKTKY